MPAATAPRLKRLGIPPAPARGAAAMEETLREGAGQADEAISTVREYNVAVPFNTLASVLLFDSIVRTMTEPSSRKQQERPANRNEHQRQRAARNGAESRGTKEDRQSELHRRIRQHPNRDGGRGNARRDR